MRSHVRIQRPNYTIDARPDLRAAFDAIFDLGRKPVVSITPPASPPGEPSLTRGQEIALLKMRKSDVSEAALQELQKGESFGFRGADFYACAEKGLATNKGSYNVLNSQGRWRADKRSHGRS